MNFAQRDHLESIRLYEIEKILRIISDESKKTKNIKILEIGAGTGWQAKKLTENGYTVEAIDLKDSNYSKKRTWPITDYDGEHIPFPDNYFNILFSSSVLEHIPHLEKFQIEMQRVLKPSGIAVHILPNGNWRFWTSIVHYPYIFKTLLSAGYSKAVTLCGKKSKMAIYVGGLQHDRKISKIKLLWKIIFPARHGETGNSFSELYYFSKTYWCSIFKKSGWKVKQTTSNNLFYTGYMLLGTLLPFQSRRYISFLLGSTCHIMVLKKK